MEARRKDGSRYAKNNPHHRLHSVLRPAQMKLTKAQRAQVFAMFAGHCAYCGVVLPEKGWQADHIEPIQRISKVVRVVGDPRQTYKYANSGRCHAPQHDHIGNIFPSCRACNINKGLSGIEDWRKFLERRPEELRKANASYRHAERFGLVAQMRTNVVFYFERIANEVSA